MSRRRPRSDTLAESLAELQSASSPRKRQRPQSERITVEADLARQEREQYRQELKAELQKLEETEKEQDDELMGIMGDVDGILARLQSPSAARQRRRKKPPPARSRSPRDVRDAGKPRDMFEEDVSPAPTVEERVNELTLVGESNEDARARIQREVQELYEHLIEMAPDFRTGEINFAWSAYRAMRAGSGSSNMEKAERLKMKALARKYELQDVVRLRRLGEKKKGAEEEKKPEKTQKLEFYSHF